MEKNFYIPKRRILPLLDRDDMLCFATDRIVVGGNIVGFMYREAPLWAYDSGWRFFAGDEDEAYLRRIENQGIYSLNMLCNYDNEILLHLSEPPGATLIRQENGRLARVARGNPILDSKSIHKTKILSGSDTPVREDLPAQGGALPTSNFCRFLTSHIGSILSTFRSSKADLGGVKIHALSPREREDCILLSTDGMSETPMTMPAELSGFGLERAELLLALPPDWPLSPLSMSDSGASWPLRLLWALTMYPRLRRTWLGRGHWVANGDPPVPYAANTRFCAAVLDWPAMLSDDLAVSDGGVHLYSVHPIYREELDFAARRGMDALLGRLRERAPDIALDPCRRSVVSFSRGNRSSS